MAHVFYGRMRIFESSGATNVAYFPATDGLMYWNENMGNAAPVMIAAVKDLNGNGITDVDFCNSPGCTLLGFGTYGLSLTSMPSAGTDPAGRLYLSYSSIYEGLNEQGVSGPFTGDNVPAKSYRHTYLMRSNDNGITWCPSIDLTDPEFVYTGNYDYIEGVYGAVAKHNNGFVHLINQQDSSPGTGVGSNIDPQGGPADILYYKIPVADLDCITTSVNGIAQQLAVTISPNPFTSQTTIRFSEEQKNTIIKIMDVLGKEIKTINFNGNQFIIEKENMVQGIYFIRIQTGNETINRKIIVQ